MVKFRDFLKKIQEKPLYIRKAILWTIVVIIGLGLLLLWIGQMGKTIKSFSRRKQRLMKRFSSPPIEKKLLEIEKEKEQIQGKIDKLKELGEESKNANNNGSRK